MSLVGAEELGIIILLVIIGALRRGGKLCSNRGTRLCGGGLLSQQFSAYQEKHGEQNDCRGQVNAESKGEFDEREVDGDGLQNSEGDFKGKPTEKSDVAYQCADELTEYQTADEKCGVPNNGL